MFFPGHKLVQSKFNCSMNSLLHLFKVCHFHGPLINKWVRRNICITLIARGHFLEDLKWPVTEKSCEVFPWVKQWACWLHTAAPVCFAIVQVCRKVAPPSSVLRFNLTATLSHDSRGNKAGWMLHGFPGPWLQGLYSRRLQYEGAQCWARLSPPSPSPVHISLPSLIAAAPSQLLFIYPSYIIKAIE